jgi:uncharacterized protein YggE
MRTTSLRRVAALAIVLSLIGGATLATPAMAVEPATRYITVSATGTTLVVPDAVRINATVSVLLKTSKESLAASSTTAAAVRKALIGNKIATKDIATQSVSVNPEYSYPQDGSAPVLTGYRASQSFNITVRAATTAGSVVDTIVTAGGDYLQINGVSPFVLNDDKAIDIARGLAVIRAKAKATSYAKLLGVKLGKVIYLDETSLSNVYPVYSNTAKAEDAATQIDLGEQKVSVSVTVRWAIG